MNQPATSMHDAYAAYLSHVDKQHPTGNSIAQQALSILADAQTVSVLDIGSGNGEIFALLADALRGSGKEVSATLIEPDSANFSILSERFSRDRLTTLIHSSWSGNKFAAGSQFDVVVAANIAYHFNDKRALLSNLWALVAPGGMLCCTAASGRTLGHPIYTQLLPSLLAHGAVSRTFGPHGEAACVEELLTATFNLSIPARFIEIQSNLCLSPAEVQQGLLCLEQLGSAAADPFCLCLSFALRVNMQGLVDHAATLRGFAHGQGWASRGIVLAANEGQLFCHKEQHSDSNRRAARGTT